MRMQTIVLNCRMSSKPEVAAVVPVAVEDSGSTGTIPIISFYEIIAKQSGIQSRAIPPVTDKTVRQIIFILQEKLYMEKPDIFSD